MEHVTKKGKPLLYLVFEYLDTDLKKFIDSRRSVNAGPLPPNVIQVFLSLKFFALSSSISFTESLCASILHIPLHRPFFPKGQDSDFCIRVLEYRVSCINY